MVDIIYLLVNSVDWEVFAQNREHLINQYLKVLNDVLETLDIASESYYTREKFQADFEKNKMFILYVMTLLPRAWREPWRRSMTTETAENAMDDLYKSPDYIILLKHWLDVLM